MFRNLSRSLRFSSRTYSTKYPFLDRLGLNEPVINGCLYGQSGQGTGKIYTSVNPSTNEEVARVVGASVEDTNKAIQAAHEAQKMWQRVPAPKRGEIVRLIGERLRENVDDLGAVIQLEVGKIKQEGRGEVQEFVDICDYAVGLSRMMQGKIVPSERPNHFMMEQYNPLGVVGVISAFNFPVAVYGWNAAISLVAGNTVVWKGAPSVPLSTIATGRLMASVFEENDLPPAIVSTLIGDAEVGQALTQNPLVPLVSFTGSTKVGGIVQTEVRQRWGQTILELGGNNALIVDRDADLDLALRATVFGSVGTAGQRCTSTRRVLLHEDVYESFVSRLVKTYGSIKIGDVIQEEGVLCGPLHSKAQVAAYQKTIQEAVAQGGRVLVGGSVLQRSGNFVQPTIIEIDPQAPVCQEETFAPILYVMKFKNFDQAIEINNQTGYGLASSLFSKNLGNIFKWVGPEGSSAGLVNVNIGTSGAEIGLPFGGNGKTGYGRESGGDAWKLYCRSSSCAVNFGNDLPLAQGIRFDV